MMRYLWPLVGFIVLVIFLGIGLSLDPREVPSPLIGKPAPTFSLPQLHAPEKAFAPEQMKGKVWLLNVWASWCTSCRAEHAVLIEMARAQPVLMVGLNYKDEPQDAQMWLAQLGNPYQLSIMDREGKVGLDWGVYGVPETFVIDKKGIIRHKHIGPVDAKAVQEELLPLLQSLNNEAG
jgi:cytochrome c biogenesis protein CcmG/thiol:disulfide interchange protein DsbE